MSQADPAIVYQQRLARFSAELASRERLARTNGNLNLVLFFGSAVTVTVGAVRSEAAWYWLAAALATAFLVALAFLRRTQEHAAHSAISLALNKEGLARLGRDWSGIPLPPIIRPPEAPGAGTSIDPATAADLDLLGQYSLQHLLNTAATPSGQTTLCHWILQPAAPATVAARQAAVRELAPLVDFRETLAARARQMGNAQDHYAGFVTWAEEAPWLIRQPAVLWSARVLPLLALILGVAAWNGWPVYLALGAVLVLILALALTAGSRAAGTIEQVEAQQEVFAAYARLFVLLEEQPFSAPELCRLQAQLQVGDATAALSASRQLRYMERLMPFASIRRWMLFLPVELFTVWNVHLLWLLERWQIRAGAHVRSWLDVLGQFEALAALATLHHDHPHWCFPTLATANTDVLTEPAPAVKATNLAHPLLPPQSAVGNDVTIGPPGSFLLVTGSNMSGKSTLLRAIGSNCVLAQMGAPVSAASLHLPPVLVASSMRVQDSLTQGVSYFLAELQSLKAIVDLAEQQTSPGREIRPGDAPLALLYLLDEILQGTNSAERQIAARHIIQRLVRSGAIGAVSTHDLALASASELTEAAVAVHFTESFLPGTGDGPAHSTGPSMHFDYKLRSGIATSTNALKLMHLIGLFPLGRTHP